MVSWTVPRLYRRAILVYLIAIVAPVAALVWLGIDTLQRQRTLIAQQARAAVAAELTRRTEAAGRAAFDAPHPIVQHTFVFESGMLVRPSLRAPFSDGVPDEFADAYRQESSGQVELALASFRALLNARARTAQTSSRRSLALARDGVARCLDRLGRHEEAREHWRQLAREFADDRDLSHRPYGIVAAIAAQETNGLADRIASGRWELSRDYAEYVLDELGPGLQLPYLQRFDFAETLDSGFRPPQALVDGQVYSDRVGGYRLFYRRHGADGVTGFSVNEKWVNTQLVPAVEQELDIRRTSTNYLRVYIGSISLVMLVLSFGVVLLLRDVSREARTNKARTELVSGISHELKTPITLMRLYSETLLRHPGFSDEERTGFYRIIARESTRLGRLIDQVLSFARVDRGAQIYHFEDADLAPIVCGVIDDYREYLEHAGFRLRRTVPEAIPAIRFDGAAISQALLNLLDNAVKYSGDSREIGIRVSVDPGQVAIEVEDHGIGIAPADQPRIFERFVRVSNGSGKGGYGLGLYLVRHIMEAHGGRAEVESEVGRGSRFRLVLPRAAA